jgi:hypothetical protein
LPHRAPYLIGSVEREGFRNVASRIAERVFVSWGSGGRSGAGSGCGRVWV